MLPLPDIHAHNSPAKNVKNNFHNIRFSCAGVANGTKIKDAKTNYVNFHANLIKNDKRERKQRDFILISNQLFDSCRVQDSTPMKSTKNGMKSFWTLPDKFNKKS